MKIGNRIALFYTSVTVGVITIVVIVFYVFTSHYINNLFQSYLIEKAFLTAQKHWEEDEVDEASYLRIIQEYDKMLPQAKEILLNADHVPQSVDSLKYYLNESQINRLLSSDIPVLFTNSNMQGAAIYYPDNEGNFFVLVMADNSYGDKIQSHILWTMLSLLLLSSVLVFFVGRIYAGRILSPLKHILKEIKRIRGNNLNVRLKTYGNKDEMEDLINTLNDMLDRINDAFHTEKSFINNASHELNNPITAIQGECEITLLKERSPLEYKESLERISSEGKRLSSLMKHLLFLSRQDNELLKNSVEQIDPEHFFANICKLNNRLQYDSSRYTNNYLRIKANPYLLSSAITNIIDNACKYSADKPVTVYLRYETNQIIVEIEDKGIGIPEEDIDHIFQSFYRGANTREYSGYGIGLSLAIKILSLFNGNIKVRSVPGIGTKVTIIFPVIPH